MKQEIERFIKLINELQKIDNEFPIQYALCLSVIALNEGISMTDLSNKTGMPLSTVSRITSALSKSSTRGKRYDLIRVDISPEEKRRKQIYLNDNGHKVIKKISKIV